jgi:thymidylate kinase
LLEEGPLHARRIYMGTNPLSGTVGLPTTRWIRRRREAVSRPGLGLRAAGYLNRVLEQWLRALVARYHRLRGRSVIFDRFVCDLYPQRTNGRERPGRRVKRWLMRAGSPKPDLVVLLDAPGEVLYERKGEHSPVRLEAQRRAYLELRSVFPRMVVIDATRDEESVRHAVTSLVWAHRTRATRVSDGLD